MNTRKKIRRQKIPPLNREFNEKNIQCARIMSHNLTYEKSLVPNRIKNRKKGNDMKKLLVAGVSTLSLMVAAPSAFGAASDLYGSYNASCTKKATTLNFYGINSSGSVAKLNSVNYDNTKNEHKFGPASSGGDNFDAALDKLAQKQLMSGPFSLKIGSTTYDLGGGLMPRAIVFFSAGNTSKELPPKVPTLTDYTSTGTANSGSGPSESFLVTKTACSMPSMFTNGINADITAGVLNNLTIVFEYRGGEYQEINAPTADSLFVKALDTIISKGNATDINFIVLYAAACNPNTETTTCSMTINENGGVQYVNSCKGGCFASEGSFGAKYTMCYDPKVFKMESVQADISNQNVALD